MDLGWISLAALLIVIVVSCTTAVNPGLLALALAFVIGVYIAPWFGQPIGVKGVAAGFPGELFLTLVAVTCLFAQAQVNGTLEQIARAAVGCCRGNLGLVPLAFFGVTLAISSTGAGSIAAAGLVAPAAMATAGRTGISVFLMALMVGHGAVAGGMSPFAPTGVIANGLMNRMGLVGYEWQIYLHNQLANVLVAAAGYVLLGGWRLLGQNHGAATKLPAQDSFAIEEREPARRSSVEPRPQKGDAQPFQRRHAVTLAVLAALIVSVIFFKVDVAVGAFAGAILLTLTRMADEREAIRAMPWSVILMVSGVSVLTALLEKTGGIDRFTDLVARVSTPQSAPGVVALLTGLVSVYSSTSGVVLPTFLPGVPGLIEKLGGGDPLAISSAMVIGGNLVDVSPLSTIGALCVAAATAAVNRRVLFNQVLIWGLSMALVAAGGCYLLFGLL